MIELEGLDILGRPYCLCEALRMTGKRFEKFEADMGCHANHRYDAVGHSLVLTLRFFIRDRVMIIGRVDNVCVGWWQAIDQRICGQEYVTEMRRDRYVSEIWTNFGDI